MYSLSYYCTHCIVCRVHKSFPVIVLLCIDGSFSLPDVAIRWMIYYSYVFFFDAPGEQDWTGPDGTILRIMEHNQFPESYLDSVHRCLKCIRAAWAAGSDYCAASESGTNCLLNMEIVRPPDDDMNMFWALWRWFLRRCITRLSTCSGWVMLW